VVLMPAKYQVYRDVAGKYRFRLRAENGRIVAASEAYEQHAGCMNGVKSVQKNCVADTEDMTVEGTRIPNPKYRVFKDEKGKFRFHLTAANGEIIAQSEGYNSREGCLSGIEAIKGSCNAEIEDLAVEQVAKAAPAEVGITPAVGALETKLELCGLPEVAKKGDVICFQGRLVRSDTNEGVPGSKIVILEQDRSFVNNELLAEGVTSDDGSFSIDWKARGVDWWDDTGEFYAEFDGNEKAKPSRSDVQTIHIE